MTYQELKDAVMKYFGDTSREAEETKTDLKTLVEEIEMLIETL